MLDRIDIHVEVPPVTFRELSPDGSTGESSSAILGRVVAAREIQAGRFRKSANATNSAMGPGQVKTHCKLDSECMSFLKHAMGKMNFSARAHDRILKVSRALSDLAGSPEIPSSDILEAIQYRSLDRKVLS